jgi:saccharopine dehydrogenase (NAD+, L-lysine-forming)
MPGILILGGTGHTGRLIAQHLLAQSNADITIASRHLDQARTLADRLNQQYPSPRANAIYADASQADSLRPAFAGHEMVVVAAPTTAHAPVVIRTALEMGVDYLDVQLGARKLALLQSLTGEIERAGRCFITEAGFHPGLPSALVRYAAGHMDVMECAITLGYLNMGHDLPYTEAVDELVDSFREYNGQVFHGGQWTKPGSYDVRTCDFGGDIGRKRCYAMFFEELRALPRLFPSLRDTGFYISEMHWMVDWVVMPITWAWLKVAPNAVRPIGKFLWWGMGTFHKPPYRVELQVQASGHTDGRPVTMRAAVAHPDGYELTAIPVVASLLQYLDGSARRPGLWMMGHLVDAPRLMRDMERMGIACTTTIRPGGGAASLDH